MRRIFYVHVPGEGTLSYHRTAEGAVRAGIEASKLELGNDWRDHWCPPHIVDALQDLDAYGHATLLDYRGAEVIVYRANLED